MVENEFLGMGKVWEKVMKKGKKQEKGLTHTLTPDEVRTIVATAHMMGCNENFVKQLNWDLTVARYKLYDEIGMLLTGRYKGYGETPKQLENQEKFTKIMATLYLTGTPKDLIKNLRTYDYQLESAYRQLMKKSKELLKDVL